ncbi:MAG: Ig-like domain-containing protein, partial [Pseudomonadota bacterium]
AGIENELSVYVGNSSRNVTISSENPEGVRGHVMFMHNPDVSVRFAEFDELGRTDKSKPINTNELWDADDGSFRGPGDDLIGTARNPGTENVEGRYSVHVHRAGAEADAQLAIIEGNSVTGSPGWGIVHHDSHAAIDYNFVYGVAGAGIVSEDANETGQWIGNFVTSTVGSGRDPARREDANVLRMEVSGDFGIDGVAFESQARAVIQQDNIAANSKTAWMFNTSETSTMGPEVDALQFDPSHAPFQEQDRVGEEDAAIVGFDGNQIIATWEGVFTGHRIIDNQSDIQQTFSNLTAWNVDKNAIQFFNYTGEYVVQDALFVNVRSAVKAGDKVEGINFVNVHVEDAYAVAELGGYNTYGEYVDVTWTDVTKTLRGADANQQGTSFDDRVRDGDSIRPVDEITFQADPDAQLEIGTGVSQILIRGSVTDSLGSFNIASNLWIRQERLEVDGLRTTIRPSDHDFMLDKYGAIKNADGSWDLAFFWWVGDRFTGENKAVFIPMPLVGFDDAYLEQYRIAEFTPPSGEVERYYTSGIQGIDGDFSGGEQQGGGGQQQPTPTPNAAPDARNDAASTEAGEAVTVDVLGNDRDADGDGLSVVGFAQGSNGSVSRGADGSLVYTPNAGFSGTDGFSYRIGDGRGGQDVASVTVTVAPPPASEPDEPDEPAPAPRPAPTTGANVAPDATDDGGFAVAPRGVVDVPVATLLANDDDANGDRLSLVWLGGVSGGSIKRMTVDGVDVVRFTAGANEGAFGFSYVIADGRGGRDSARVSIAVEDGATPPPVVEPGDGAVLLEETFDGAPGASNLIVSTPLLDGDGVALARGADSGLTVFKAVSVAGRTGVAAEIEVRAPEGGSFDVAGGGRDYFRVEVSYDGGAPTLIDELSYDATARAFVSATTGQRIDGDFGKLSYDLVEANSVQLRVTAHVTGVDETFEIDAVRIVDTDAASPTPPEENENPVARNDAASTAAGTAVAIDVLANDSDADGDALAIVGFSQGANGSVTRGADGKLVYRPEDGFSGQDRFTYRLDDGEGGQDVATVVVDVAAGPTPDPSPPTQNVAPDASDDGPFTVDPRGVIDIPVASLLGNDSDPNGDALSLVWLGGVTGGRIARLEVNGVDVIRFTAGSNEGDAGFNYVVADGRGGRDSARVEISVQDDQAPPPPPPPPGDGVILLEETFDVAPGASDAIVSTPLLDGDGAALARGADSGLTVFKPVDVAGRDGVSVEIEARAPAGGSFDGGGGGRDYFRVEAVYNGRSPTLLDELSYDAARGAFVSATTGQRI